jgi:hypothetical protein
MNEVYRIRVLISRVFPLHLIPVSSCGPTQTNNPKACSGRLLSIHLLVLADAMPLPCALLCGLHFELYDKKKHYDALLVIKMTSVQEA